MSAYAIGNILLFVATKGMQLTALGAIMHPKSDILLKWHFETIDFYFEKSLQYYLELIELSSDEMVLPKLSDKDLAIGSFQYFRQSVLYELNALVEHYFQYAASNDALLLSNSNLKRSRGESIKTIMEKYNLDIQDFPNYIEVKKLYSIVNALKHRGSFEYTDFTKSIPEIKVTESDINTIKILKAGVFEFLKALINRILLNENK